MTTPTGDREGDRELVTERLRRLAVPVAVVLTALLVVFLSYQGPLLGAVVAIVVVVVVVLWLRGRTSEEAGPYGPGADDEDRY